jgi:hypothetical protein
MTSHSQGEDLPAEVDQRRKAAREIQRQSIARHLARKTSFERIETYHRYLVDCAAYLGPPTDWPHLAEEWREFKSALVDGDEIWEFNTVSVHLGFSSGEEGFTLLRNGTVVSWFITAVVG